MKRSTETPKPESPAASATLKDRYTSLLESLVQEEVRRRDRSLLSDWRAELAALQTPRR